MLSTWRALLEPRRAAPIGLVAIGAIGTEWIASGTLAALLVDLALLVAFLLVAPASWRELVARRHGVAAYLGACALVLAPFAILPALSVIPWTYVLDRSSIGVLFVLFAVGGWGLGRDVELERGLLAERDRAERLALEAERAQLLALRAHLDPHFLFNVLNAIAEWCRQDPEVAERATLRLASMLRAMLEGTSGASWPLERELDLGRSLLELYEVRDRERFRFRLDVAHAPLALLVPPMVLLPIFENAITHGPAAGHDGEVELVVRVRDGQLSIEVGNPGAFRGPRDGGRGVAMVERRLRLAYGDAARLAITSDGARTRAVVTLPLAAAPSAA